MNLENIAQALGDEFEGLRNRINKDSSSLFGKDVRSALKSQVEPVPESGKNEFIDTVVRLNRKVR